MKKLNIDKVIRVIANNENQVEVDKEIREKALIPLKRMLELGA